MRLTAADVIAGVPLGFADNAAAPAVAMPVADPWTALEGALLPALAAAPVAIAFSGGRDSSLLLAVAVSAARRHGLSPPIAITNRFPHVLSSLESEWQESVIRKLEISDWEVLTLDNELDFLGDIARQGLVRDGLQSPPNAQSLVPVARALRHGTVVVGVGGDELLGGWRWAGRLAAQRRPLTDGLRRGPKAVGGVLLGSAPSVVRRSVFRHRLVTQLRRGADGYGWLTASGRQAILAGLTEFEDQPVLWSDFVYWAASRRLITEVLATLQRLALAEGVEVSAPLLDPAVLAALAAVRGRHGWTTRSEAMMEIAGDRLPVEVVTRRSKAEFTGAFWGPGARDFVAQWDGSGVNSRFVDIEALRAEWSKDRPDFRSMLLLQSAWLAQQL